jgi:peptidyl-prolyl cis-trans isomerase A (cyclophilin A)
MKLVMAISISLASTLMYASGCISQTAARPQATPQQTANPVSEAPAGTQGSDSKNAARHPGLLDPSKANEQAPETFKVKMSTTKGDFVIAVTRKWSPNGADRFYNLVKIGYFQDIAIFRAIKGFMFQFGIHGDPNVSAKWSNSNIKDDPNAGISNEKGFITFAKTGQPNSRSTQLFVNLGNNRGLDAQGFTPFGQVVSGMDVVEKINTEYGENPRDLQGNFEAGGNEYVLKRFPNLDIIKSATIIEQ